MSDFINTHSLKYGFCNKYRLGSNGNRLSHLPMIATTHRERKLLSGLLGQFGSVDLPDLAANLVVLAGDIDRGIKGV
jgi:hypothetical protein